MWTGYYCFLFTNLYTASLAMNDKINIREMEQKTLEQIFQNGKYDARIRPTGTNGTENGPVLVYVNMVISQISVIDDYKMELSVEMKLQERWIDERLKFNDLQGRLKYLPLNDAKKVWKPDLVFQNAKEVHFENSIMPNVIQIFPNGSVIYSTLVSLTLHCPINLKLFPLDRQICFIDITNYGSTTNDVLFLWNKDDAVNVVQNIGIHSFTLKKYLTDYCTTKTNTGEYSCLKVSLLLEREFVYYLIRIYIPSSMSIIISWLTFWIDQNAVSARVSLGVASLLTMLPQAHAFSLPSVHYTKAIDIWYGACLILLFGALVEFTLVNYVSRSDNHNENMGANNSDVELGNLDATINMPDPKIPRPPGDPTSLQTLCQCQVARQPHKCPNRCKFLKSQCPRSKRIDVIARITFPLLFEFFNLVYWCTYLDREEEDWQQQLN